jgi:hypothetical protein
MWPAQLFGFLVRIRVSILFWFNSNNFSSAYFTSLVSAILVLYSPADVESSFFAQLLNVYSLVNAAIIAIAKHNLTKLQCCCCDVGCVTSQLVSTGLRCPQPFW